MTVRCFAQPSMTTPASDVSACVRHAATLCQNGQFADALSLVAPQLDAPAVDVAVLHVAAVCALGLNHLADAEASWRRAIDAMPAFEPPTTAFTRC